jgi:biopolymer transport protein ExbD
MKRVIAMLVAVACVVGCQGCGTTGRQGTSKVRISVLGEGKLSVNGRMTTTPTLAKTVKAAGARPTTAIEVSIPSGAPQAVMVSITRELRQAGYTKILFVRPRQARVVIPK